MRGSADIEDQEVIAEVLNGGTEAFRFLVRKYQKPIYNLMVRTTGCLEESADLTQDAFLKAYEKLGRYRPDKKFFSWLYALSLNVARDHLRRTRRMTRFADDALRLQSIHDEPQHGHEGAAGDSQALYEALSRLPDQQREAVVLRYREGFSMKEIAEALQISTSGAKMRVHRGLDQLRTVLSGDDHETQRCIAPSDRSRDERRTWPHH